MATSAISSTATTSTSALTSSRETIAENFDTFLTILTTQLRNQNPLDPLDTNEFTAQLVQFTSVEQQLKTNEYLEALIALNDTATTATNSEAIGLIGKEITVSTAATSLSGGQASWNYWLAADAQAATITVSDAAGNTVYTEEKALDGGNGTFTWDGIGTNGVEYPSGTYTITIDAKNSSGDTVTATVEMTGTVEGVDLTGDEPYLIVGSAYVALSSITSVRATGS